MEVPVTHPNMLIVELSQNGSHGLEFNHLATNQIESADVETSEGKRITLKNHPANLPKVTIQACAFVDASDLLGEGWSEWFWEEFDQDEFSWGDNNRTLITPERFVSACDSIEWGDHGVSRKAAAAWCKRILNLGNVYIDLEN